MTMMVLKERGRLSSRSDFQPVDGGQLRATSFHLSPQLPGGSWTGYELLQEPGKRAQLAKDAALKARKGGRHWTCAVRTLNKAMGSTVPSEVIT